ncbi:MAG: hypothetical protein GY696_05400 [Gammaproteobacteria bacterium]|nr:hypothetical protein [Gammaproteobacteria bacterium]
MNTPHNMKIKVSTNNTFLSLLLYLLCGALVTVSANVFAANVSVTATPTAWRLQNYVGDKVVAYYTGSTCDHGQLTFGSNGTNDDKNRFWSVIMSAKIARKPVIVYYDNSAAPAQCLITSFMLVEE